MAIIQSILVGKGKGKIGNVVLSNLKGQTVAKQLNSAPSNPRTVAQTENRVQMANAVLAWQFLALFFAGAKGLRKPLESIYNAFVRLVKNDMSTNDYPNRVIAAKESLISGLFYGNWFDIAITSFTASSVVLSLNNAGVELRSSYRVCAILIATGTEVQRVVDIPLSEASYVDGSVSVAFEELLGADLAAAYVYDSMSSKITNIAAFVQ